MKISGFSILFILFICGSCGLNEREQSIKQKEATLNQKQQQLLLLEQKLSQKEQALVEREHRLDSTKKEIDSVAIHGPSIIGRWQVKMQCVETSCNGSAIGDVKTEQWEFGVENNVIVAKAYAGKNLTRIYNGSYTQSGLQLTDQTSMANNTTIEVTLRILNDKKLDGLREITMPDCKTTYSITADRL